MISTHKNRSYTTQRTKVGDRFRVDYVLRCGECDAVETIHMDPQCRPDLIVKKFNLKGWKADERNPARNLCPLCQGAKPQETPVETPMPREDVMADMPKGPTHEQRKRIAQHLRGVFDEQRGRYLESHNDQTVGQELQVPWAWVRECRDLLGFEIKIDPEVEALRNEFEAMAEMLIALEAKLKALEARRLAS